MLCEVSRCELRQEDGKTNMTRIDFAKSYIKMVLNDIKLVSMVCKKYKGCIRVLLNVLLKKYPIKATMRNGERRRLDSFESFYNNLLGLNFDPKQDVVHIGNYSFCGGMSHGDNIAGIFNRKEYSFLDAKGKTVVDIGGGIGDSAVYFAESGADRVISVEANKTNHELARRNIDANNVGDKVELLWAACASEELSNAENSSDFKNVPRISLTKILESSSKGSPLVLKIDCEGCEYDVLMSLPINILSKVSRVQVEYHYGYLNLKRKLESANFEVTTTGPRYFKPRNLGKSIMFYDRIKRKDESMFLGWIYAKNRLG